ncbi:hypothetical protein [Microbacterium oleivorans]|uniref:Uncharacterized protein n=1 Tax=Microbacterium oleivorans TaxID=273677 RepID=A0A177KFF6_9MICO|nr:hypothetical protein [Microbacterium oleivorans]OAH51827.1 hypothetical protein AYL44_06250 [Microbacterium oleivorans]
MDALSNRVRDLAPNVEPTREAVAAAREQLARAIAAEPAGARRRTWRLPALPAVNLRLLTAAVAVVTVAVIAVGAFVATQVLSRPEIAAPPAVDLSRPVQDQLDGRTLRIATVTEGPQRYDLPDGSASSDSYLLVRSVSASYVSADGSVTHVFEDEPSSLVSTHGPDGPAMAESFVAGSDRSVQESTRIPEGWTEGLPVDGQGILDAFAERHGLDAAAAMAESVPTFLVYVLPDPAWYFLTVAQREAVVDTVVAGGGLSRSAEGADIVLSADDDLLGVTRMARDSLVPVSGSTPSWAGDGLPATTWTNEVSFVDATPSQSEPDAAPTSACGGVPIPDSAYAGTGLSSLLDDNGRAAIAGQGVPELGEEEWAPVEQSEDRVVLWSWSLHDGSTPRDPEPGEPAATHEVLTISRDAGGAWVVTDWSQCLMTQLVDGYRTVDVALDAAAADPAAARLPLLVSEGGCPVDAAAIELLQENQNTDVVEVLVALRDDVQTPACVDSGATPFTIDLDEPLGSRPVIDLAYLEGRNLRVP